LSNYNISGYRITEIKFEELIKIREKLASKESDSDKLSTPKLGGQGNQMNQMVKLLKILLKSLPLTI
jgi:flagellar basal body rod protein FlgG